jgi:hypothetical protein
MRVIVWTHPSTGTVAVSTPSPTWDGDLHQLAKLVVSKGVHYKIMDTSELPQDLTYRDAWQIYLNDTNSDGVGNSV